MVDANCLCWVRVDDVQFLDQRTQSRAIVTFRMSKSTAWQTELRNRTWQLSLANAMPILDIMGINWFEVNHQTVVFRSKKTIQTILRLKIAEPHALKKYACCCLDNNKKSFSVTTFFLIFVRSLFEYEYLWSQLLKTNFRPMSS